MDRNALNAVSSEGFIGFSGFLGSLGFFGGVLWDSLGLAVDCFNLFGI